MKEPIMGQDDPKVCKKWCDILNRCSLDLVLLVIENQNKRLVMVYQEIINQDIQLKSKFFSA